MKVWKYYLNTKLNDLALGFKVTGKQGHPRMWMYNFLCLINQPLHQDYRFSGL